MKVYGHRGAAGEAPENTLAGFLHAVERGARYLELRTEQFVDRRGLIEPLKRAPVQLRAGLFRLRRDR